MSSNGSLLPYPTGKSNDQLYAHTRALVDALQRLLASGEIVRRVGAVEGQIEGIEDTVADVEATTNTLASNYTTILAQVGVNSEDIVELFAALDGVGGSGLTPQQAFILGLVSAVDTVLGSVSQQVLETKQLSERLAQAAITEMVRGRVDGASIKVEQAVRTTETLSLAQQITTLTADLGTANAAIVSEQTARAGADTTLSNSLANEITNRTNADSALAANITSLTTTVNGNTTQVTILAASIDGIEGRFGVAINSNGQVTGLIQLDGTPSGSTFTVVADKFQIAQPSTSGGDPVPVFTIANVSGVPKLVFRGDMLADGAIVARAIGAAQITADKIAANAITADKLAATLITTTRIQNPANTNFWDFNTGAFQIT